MISFEDEVRGCRHDHTRARGVYDMKLRTWMLSCYIMGRLKHSAEAKSIRQWASNLRRSKRPENEVSTQTDETHDETSIAPQVPAKVTEPSTDQSQPAGPPS